LPNNTPHDTSRLRGCAYLKRLLLIPEEAATNTLRGCY
jgi:hypothetical protein